MTRAEFDKEHPDSADAEAITSKPNIDFIKGKVSLGTVRHEVRHAYVAECHLESTELSAENMEEVNATLDEYKWDKMNKTSQTIFTNLTNSKKNKGTSDKTHESTVPSPSACIAHILRPEQ
jgi:hypothetical protein